MAEEQPCCIIGTFGLAIALNQSLPKIPPCATDNETFGMHGAVCWYIDRENRNAEVGYWLGAPFTGRGLATRAGRAVVGYLFEREAVHRVEMQCGVANSASRAVAERCGLIAEGVRRESHWITDRYVDHVVYGILDREWTSGSGMGAE